MSSFIATEAKKNQVKLVYSGDIRRATLPTSASFAELLALVHRVTKVPAETALKLKYKDDEDDMIRLTTSEELSEAFEVAKAQKKTLKIFIRPDVPKPASPKGKGAADETVPEDSNWDLVSPPSPQEKAENKNAKQSIDVPEVSGKGRRHGGFRGGRNWRDLKAEREEKAKAKQAKAGFKQAKKQWQETRRGWREQWKQQRQEAKSTFCEKLKSFWNDDEVKKALFEALPVATDRLVKGETIPSVIDSVLSDHKVLKENSLVQELAPQAKLLSALLPTAIIGPILVDVLLEIQHLLKNEKIDTELHPIKLFKRILRLVKRACRLNAPEIHHGIGCDVSGMCPIIGNRWKKKGEDYDLCQAEYEKLSEEDKKNFEQIDACNSSPFEGSLGIVPGMFGMLFGNGCPPPPPHPHFGPPGFGGPWPHGGGRPGHFRGGRGRGPPRRGGGGGGFGYGGMGGQGGFRQYRW